MADQTTLQSPESPAASGDDALNPAHEASKAQSKTTTAGLVHELNLNTRYYRATVPIWIDEAPDLPVWRGDFLSPDASDVVKAVGAWIVVFEKTKMGWESARALMGAIKEAVATAYGGEDVWDGCLLCVGMPAKHDAIQQHEGALSTIYEEWEDDAFDLGFELVDGEIDQKDGKTRNNAGELRGVARLTEALEANEWENVDDIDEAAFGLNGDGLDAGTLFGVGDAADESSGFRLERAQMEREFAGLSMAMANDDASHGQGSDDEERQVEETEKMMLKMQAARDMSAHLPEQERKRFARKTVNEILNEI